VSQVLALKYRPSNFDKLVGQNHIVQTLIHALDQKRISHAYLFSGLRGSGKTTTARIFSKALQCDKGPTAKPCEVCENCKMANENRHIDIIEMDAASSRKIDDIRDLIEHTKYKPNSARFKIFIIDEVHMLTREAFNALLKTLEEPPSFVKFILATTDPLKLPATILSRVQHFRFKKISQEDIVHHLSHILNLENIAYEIEALEMLSRAGAGSLRDTLTLLDQAIIFSKGEIKANEIASMLGLIDPAYLADIFDAILCRDRKKLIEIIKDLQNYESEVVIDELIAYLKERFFEQDVRFSTLLCDRFFRILSEAKNLLFLNADSGFILTLVFFKMVEATYIKEVDQMIESYEKEIKKTKTTSPAPLTPALHAEKSAATDDKKQISQKPFEKLIAALYDRNYELGECFEKSIKFVSFKDNDLALISCADNECKTKLRHASGVIKHFVKEIFGFETKITMRPCNKNQDNLSQKMKNEELHANEESGSMIEDIETTPASKNKKEFDAKEIMENPFIKKATELFEPTKIIIKPKV
jgi:DNA polymerase-3 subunit gamma/tau